MIIGPYSLQESWHWLRKYLRGPTRTHAITPAFPPSHLRLHDIGKRELEIIFFGDLMNLYSRKLVFSDEIREWVKTCDHIVINLEGPLTLRPSYLYLRQRNDPSLLSKLAELAPLHKYIFSLGNNHSLDFGPTELKRCVDQLLLSGAQVIGTEDHPSVILQKKVYLAGATAWSNRAGQGLHWLKSHPRQEEASAAADLRILYTHWGHEFELYPRPQQVREAQEYLKHWDTIVGHHSHCPQPIVAEPKPVIYSLGNFAVGYTKPVLNYGLTVKLQIGTSIAEPTKWEIGALDWRFLHIETARKNAVHLNLESHCPFFPHTLA